MPLQEGDKAPSFTLPASAGETVSLDDYSGRTLILYFYPKDDTPGCTTEAKDFTALATDFQAEGAAILGVSKDTPAKHDKFITKHDLTIPLASDESGAMLEEYGVWVEKNMYGRKYMGIERATFLIDGKGTIRQVWRRVKVKGHASAALEAVRNLD